MKKWEIIRKQPYTELGIKRLKCIRCGDPATRQWQICSDGNNYRPLCDKCDIHLNLHVLVFMRHPNKKQLHKEYVKSLGYNKGEA